MKKIETFDYCGANCGYVLITDKWQIAYLNSYAKNKLGSIKKVDSHHKKDEIVFEVVDVRQVVTHNTTLFENTRMYIIEDTNLIWVLISEPFPNSSKVRARSISSFSNWLVNSATAFSFPIIAVSFPTRTDLGYTFIFYDISTLISYSLYKKCVKARERHLCYLLSNILSFNNLSKLIIND